MLLNRGFKRGSLRTLNLWFSSNFILLENNQFRVWRGRGAIFTIIIFQSIFVRPTSKVEHLRRNILAIFLLLVNFTLDVSTGSLLHVTFDTCYICEMNAVIFISFVFLPIQGYFIECSGIKCDRLQCSTLVTNEASLSNELAYTYQF